MRSSVIGNTTSALTAQSAFLNNFENVANRRVDIREDIKRYQDTLSYASSKVDYSVGENIYMLPCDMNLKIKTGIVWYNDKILISNGKFSLGKNNEVNVSTMKSHAQTAANSNDVLGPQTLLVKPHSAICGAHAPTVTHNQEPPWPHTITPRSGVGLTIATTMKTLLWYWLWRVVLQYGICFDKKVFPRRRFCMGHLLR